MPHTSGERCVSDLRFYTGKFPPVKTTLGRLFRTFEMRSLSSSGFAMGLGARLFRACISKIDRVPIGSVTCAMPKIHTSSSSPPSALASASRRCAANQLFQGYLSKNTSPKVLSQGFHSLKSACRSIVQQGGGRNVQTSLHTTGPAEQGTTALAMAAAQRALRMPVVSQCRGFRCGNLSVTAQTLKPLVRHLCGVGSAVGCRWRPM